MIVLIDWLMIVITYIVLCNLVVSIQEDNCNYNWNHNMYFLCSLVCRHLSSFWIGLECENRSEFMETAKQTRCWWWTKYCDDREILLWNHVSLWEFTYENNQEGHIHGYNYSFQVRHMFLHCSLCCNHNWHYNLLSIIISSSKWGRERMRTSDRKQWRSMRSWRRELVNRYHNHYSCRFRFLLLILFLVLYLVLRLPCVQLLPYHPG